PFEITNVARSELQETASVLRELGKMVQRFGPETQQQLQTDMQRFIRDLSRGSQGSQKVQQLIRTRHAEVPKVEIFSHEFEQGYREETVPDFVFSPDENDFFILERDGPEESKKVRRVNIRRPRSSHQIFHIAS